MVMLGQTPRNIKRGTSEGEDEEWVRSFPDMNESVRNSLFNTFFGQIKTMKKPHQTNTFKFRLRRIQIKPPVHEKKQTWTKEKTKRGWK